MRSSLDALIHTVDAVDWELDDRDLADIAWLANCLARFGETASFLLTSPKASNVQVTDGDQAPPEERPAGKKSLEPSPESEEPQQSGETESVGLGVPTPSEQDTFTPARRVTVPAASALPEKLRLARSLRPLMRRTPSRTRFEFDEERTVERIAEGDVWVPLMKPVSERQHRVTLVVDASLSMIVWRQTAAEFRHVLEWTGAFRRVDVVEIVADASVTDVRLDLSPDRNHLILVLSDCVSRAWWTGDLWNQMESWSQQATVALLDMLPEPMWDRTALSQGLGVRMSRAFSGTSNRSFRANPLDDWMEWEPAAGLHLPILTVEPESLRPFALALADSGGEFPGMVFGGERRGLSAPKEPVLSPEERIRRFERISSRTARRLAHFLAIAPVLSLQIIRLIRTTMLPSARQVHEAEVLLGGLIRASEPALGFRESNDVYFQFHEGVPEPLLRSVPVPDWLEILGIVSEYVERHLGTSLHGFRAILEDPTSETLDVQSASAPFVQLAAKRLERLGGAYSDWAQNCLKTTSRPKPSKPAVPPAQYSSMHTIEFGPDGFPQMAGGKDDEQAGGPVRDATINFGPDGFPQEPGSKDENQAPESAPDKSPPRSTGMTIEFGPDGFPQMAGGKDDEQAGGPVRDATIELGPDGFPRNTPHKNAPVVEFGPDGYPLNDTTSPEELPQTSPELSAACPHCGYVLEFPNRSFFGRKAKCPKCNHKFITQPMEADEEAKDTSKLASAREGQPSTTFHPREEHADTAQDEIRAEAELVELKKSRPKRGEAKLRLRELMRRYPQTSAAQEARRMLERLESGASEPSDDRPESIAAPTVSDTDAGTIRDDIVIREESDKALYERDVEALRVYLSFRRDDYLVQIQEGLKRHLGEKITVQTFADFHRTGDVRSQIAAGVTACGVVLTLVDADWVVADHGDIVRLEIEAALNEEVPLIPVLLGPAELPRTSDVPKSIAPFTALEPVRLGPSTFEEDIATLAESLRNLGRQSSPALPQAARQSNPSRSDRPTVYVSHSLQDRSFVESQLAPLFEGNNFKLTFGDAIISAQPVRFAEVEDWLLENWEQCDCFVVVLSPDAVRSSYVRKEVEWAVQHRRERIVPVLLRDCEPEALSPRFSKIDVLDFRKPLEQDEQNLVHTLRRKLDSPTLDDLRLRYEESGKAAHLDELANGLREEWRRLHSLGELQASISLATELELLARKDGEKILVVEALSQQAAIREDLGDFDRTLELLKSLEKEYRELKDNSALEKCLAWQDAIWQAGHTDGESETQTACDVYVSHAASDTTEAERLTDFLKGLGYDCWRYGDFFTAKGSKHQPNRKRFSQKMLQSCEFVVFLLSYESNSSKHIRAELKEAGRLGKPLFLIRMEKLWSSLPLREIFEFVHEININDSLDEALHELEKVLDYLSE